MAHSFTDALCCDKTAKTMWERRQKFSDSSALSVAVICSGRQKHVFEIALDVHAQNLASASLVCELNSVTGPGRDGGNRPSKDMKLQENIAGQLRAFKRALVQVSKNGARLTLYSDTPCGTAVSKTASISFSGPFPWLLSFGVRRASRGYCLTFGRHTFAARYGSNILEHRAPIF